MKEYDHIALEVRKKLLENIVKAGGGHTGGSMSSVDLLVALYFGVMHIDPDRPDWKDRDRFIMSKGHSVESYHAVLSKRGFFSEEILDSYGDFNSLLAGHPTRKVPGIEQNTGALGHGHGFDLLFGHAGGFKCLAHHRYDGFDVFAGGQFGHHTAVLGMHLYLAVQGMAQQAPLAVIYGDAGFIAGCFDT